MKLQLASAVKQLLEMADASVIQEKLEQINRENKIETSPLVRTKNFVNRHNNRFADPEKFGIEGHKLKPEEIKIKMPAYVKESTESTAAIKNCRKLELEAK